MWNAGGTHVEPQADLKSDSSVRSVSRVDGERTGDFKKTEKEMGKVTDQRFSVPRQNTFSTK